MECRLDGRVALVTGGSRGIGRAIALELARSGADVAINFRRDEAAAHAVVAEIRALSRGADAFAASVERWDDDVRLVEQVLARFGRIDILINNAGIASRGHTVADTDPAELERVLRVHAFGPHHLSKLVIPHMRKQKRGDIVMISSVATDYCSANGGPYTMGKAAMEALARTIAKEERIHGIRCNIVAPSLTVTEMGIRLAKAARRVSDIHELDGAAPFGHVSVPEDVAKAVTFLVTDANPYINGQRVAVDGGGP